MFIPNELPVKFELTSVKPDGSWRDKVIDLINHFLANKERYSAKHFVLDDKAIELITELEIPPHEFKKTINYVLNNNKPGPGYNKEPRVDPLNILIKSIRNNLFEDKIYCYNNSDGTNRPSIFNIDSRLIKSQHDYAKHTDISREDYCIAEALRTWADDIIQCWDQRVPLNLNFIYKEWFIEEVLMELAYAKSGNNFLFFMNDITDFIIHVKCKTLKDHAIRVRNTTKVRAYGNY